MMKKLDGEMNIICRSPLFAGMSAREAEEAVALLGGFTAEYRKGELLHRPGEAMRSFGLVLRGTVQACCDGFDGSRMIMAEVRPGTTFGEALCFLKIENSPVYIFASEDCGILWLSPATLYSGSTDAKLSEMQRRFASLLAARTLSMNDRIQILSRLTIREKLSVYFNEMTEGGKRSEFTITLSRQDLAAYVGADRAALSRELSRMKRDGLIDYSGKTFRLMKNIEL